MTTSLLLRSKLLLLNDDLPPDQIRNLLAPVGFSNWESAYKNLQRIADGSPQLRAALAEGLPSLLGALQGIATPNRVLVSFERFVQSADNPTALLQYLAKNPRGFEILATLFAGSQFLTEILLRHPEYFAQLVDHKSLAQIKTRTQLHADVRHVIQPFLSQPADDLTPALDALRRFQRHELLRVGTCDLLGLLDLTTVTLQLAHLADCLAQAGILLAAHATQTSADGFVVIGMGKLGGEELNYSSDIDLIFLAETEPNTYAKMGQTLIDILSRNTSEGFLYRVDMRLRPWGRSGALVTTVDGYIEYLKKNAGLWERQALLKARPIAGTMAVGQHFIEQARPVIYDNGDQPLRAEIHRLKQRIESQLGKRGRNWGEVKLGQGSIRDIEFVTQYLQLAHGPNPKFHTATTLKALGGLNSAGILPADEYRVLTSGYTFLRTIEHHLQLMHYRQTHTLPKEWAALCSLAKRLGFQGEKAGDDFTSQFQQHSAVIRAVYQRHLADAPDTAPDPDAPDVLPLLVRMHPSYVSTFSPADIEHHARLILRLQEAAPIKVEAVPISNGYWRVTIVGFDYIGLLSLICGLMVAYGLDITEGSIFSYGPDPTPTPPQKKRPWSRWRRAGANHNRQERKIVDVFTVRPLQEHGHFKQITPETWDSYAADLTDLFRLLQSDEPRKAQGKLAKRVAVTVPQHNAATLPPTLLPVDVTIDNNLSNRHTVLRIDALDTFGFLYELTNALALSGINIRRMTVASEGSRVQDILYVTDSQKNKITAPEKQYELRVAVVLIKHFTHLLPRSPNPEAALLNFREFVGRLFTHTNWTEELVSLEQPEVLGNLARLLGVSDFLWSDFLRMQHSTLFPVVSNTEALSRATSRAELREELAIAVATAPKGDGQREALNAFKDREMFRIDMRQIQGHTPEFGRFSAELTDLAEVVVEAATQLAAHELRTQFGVPRLENGSECPLSVCALGKCGGQELGFASDIELMFIFAGHGRTSGPRVITTAEYFTKLVQEVNQIIQTKREGIFELDLRLRPYGSAGSMAVSQESFQTYFGPSGDAWPYERQALVKLRPITGDQKFGQQIVRLRDQLIYTDQPFDVAAMRAMRERQIRHLVKAGTFHAKFSPGGLVDAEYLVQGLQITYGHLDASLRQPNTYEVMRALAAIKIIAPKDYPRLQEAYTFFRTLINALRMVRGNAKDLTVPDSTEEAFAFLARRLDYGDDIIRLQNDLQRHTSFIRKLSDRLLNQI